MTKDELHNLYFDWMYRLVCDDQYTKTLSYRKLFAQLHNTPFTYLMPMDGNRASDGEDLRYRFGYENGIDRRVIAADLDIRPCSVLEMMVALAIRCEADIMQEDEEGNRTGQWFWNMLVSLHLGGQNDFRYDKNYVNNIIQRFLNRAYKPNGDGGLFTIENCSYDLTTVEIWYQMNWYLSSILDTL